MAQGTPFESVFQEASGKGDQAVSDGVDGLCAQLKDDRTAHTDIRWRAMGNLGFPFETDTWLPPLPT